MAGATAARKFREPNEHEIRTWHDNHFRRTTPETKKNIWQHFVNLQDPYNPDNFVTGWVQMIGGEEYGNLILEEVNERPAPQRITATTPKTSYPYGRAGQWLLQSAQWVRAARKYDGTNICQYSYEDADGRRFTTFKLRTRPFLTAKFRVMLDRTLKRYPKAAALEMTPGEAMIYELYGRQNPMLIIYEENIELRAIFRRNPETGDIDPADPEDPAFSRLDCPLAAAAPVEAWPNPMGEYRSRQESYSRGLSEVTVNEERAFHGHEGEMLYVRFPDGARSEPGEFTRLIKLKPPEIEEIHQALDHVPKKEIEATMRNVWEATDEPETDHLKTMLLEEWTEDQVRRSAETIGRVFEDAVERRRFEGELLAEFGKNFRPEQFRADRGTVMRALSKKYPKGMMQKVYGILDIRLP